MKIDGTRELNRETFSKDTFCNSTEVIKMNTQHTYKLAPVQNIGLVDRIARFFVGGALLAGGTLWIALGNEILYGVVAALLSIYPLMTTMMGWDPIYQLSGSKTCSVEGGRNACGTFPYEVDAALGNRPVPKEEFDHSLGGSEHKPGQRKAA